MQAVNSRNPKNGYMAALKQKVFNPFLARKLLQRYYHIAFKFLDEFKSSAKLNIRHSLKAWFHGFGRFNYRLYSLDSTGDLNDYLSDVQMIKQLGINDRYTDLIISKLNFTLLMNKYGMPTPRLRGAFRNGVYYPIDSHKLLSPVEFLAEYSSNSKSLAVRPNWGVHGDGFFKISRDKEGYLINGESIAVRDLIDALERLDDYLVTDFVQQSTYGAQLYPHTTNTLRIITLWDLDQGKPFIARAVQRIGTTRSYPVDNFKAGLGGLSASVDLDSGELSAAANATPQGQVIWHQRHPEHQNEIQGRIVPNWAEICRSLLMYASNLFFFPSIAWDVVPTDTGFTIIEGNPYSGMAVIQVHGPLLNDPRIRKTYRHYGVIK